MNSKLYWLKIDINFNNNNTVDELKIKIIKTPAIIKFSQNNYKT